MFYNHAPIVLK